MGLKKTVASNTLSQIIGKIVSGGVTFLISLLVARTLGTAGYGDFTKITTFVAVFYLFADFGFNAAYVRFAQETEHGDRRYFPSLFTLRTLLSVVLMIVSSCIIALLPSSAYPLPVKYGMLVFLPTVLFQSYITTANAVFQKRLQYDFATYALTIGSVITLFGAFFLTGRMSRSVLFFVAALAGGSLATAAASLIFIRRLRIPLTLQWDAGDIRRLLLTSLPLGLTLLSNVVYFRADSFIMTFTRSTSDVGIYGFAYRLFEFPLVVPTFFMNAVYPTLTAVSKSPVLFVSRLRKSAVALSAVSIALTAAGFLLSPYITLIRPEFAQSIVPFRILIASLPFFFLSSLSMWTLIALDMRAYLFGIYTMFMIANILSNAVFIPSYGYTAAAWITFISEGMVCLVSWLIIWKSRRVSVNG